MLRRGGWGRLLLPKLDLTKFAFLVKIRYIILHKAKPYSRTGVWTMQDQNNAKLGFNAAAENLNGRAAMIGFVAAVVTELVTGQGVLHFLGIM
jgi:hypothetical protein